MRQKKSAQLRVWGELGTWAKKVEGLFCMLSVYLQLGRKRIRPNYEWRVNLQPKQKVETRKKMLGPVASRGWTCNYDRKSRY